MKKILMVLCLLTIAAFPVWGYDSDLKEWGEEILEPEDLNDAFSDVAIVDDMADSLFLRVLKTSVADSINAIVTDSLALSVLKVDVADSINARMQTSFPLFYTGAFVDSTAENDSLTIEITENSPLGTKQSLFILNNAGEKETVTLVLDGFLWNKIGVLDSLHYYIWTETTDKTDFVSTTVYQDSLDTHFKGTASASVDSSCSSTARTAKIVSVTDIDITDDEFRVKLLVETQSDSMFIGEIKCFISSP